MTCRRHADPCMPCDGALSGGCRALRPTVWRRRNTAVSESANTPGISAETCEPRSVRRGRFDMVGGEEGQRKVLQGKSGSPAVFREQRIAYL